jgi:hypothetical protein
MAGSLTARAITCGSPPPTPTLGGFSELWSLAIASMAQPRIGSKAAKPECETGAQDSDSIVSRAPGASSPTPRSRRSRTSSYACGDGCSSGGIGPGPGRCPERQFRRAALRASRRQAAVRYAKRGRSIRPEHWPECRCRHRSPSIKPSKTLYSYPVERVLYRLRRWGERLADDEVKVSAQPGRLLLPRCRARRSSSWASGRSIS